MWQLSGSSAAGAGLPALLCSQQRLPSRSPSCQMVLGPLWDFLLACLSFFACYLSKAFQFLMGLCVSGTAVWGKAARIRARNHPTSCELQVGQEALPGCVWLVVSAEQLQIAERSKGQIIHLQGFHGVACPFWIFYCHLVGAGVAAGGVHWKGEDERVGVWAGVVLSLTKAFPEPADSGWVKRVCPGEELPAVTAKVLCVWRVGKGFWSEVGDGLWQRWMATVHPGCCASASASAQVRMAPREALESLLTVALCTSS